MSFVAFVLSFAGFVCLAVSVPRHCRHVFGRELQKRLSLILRVAGWLLFAASLAASIAMAGGFVGPITWFGVLTISAVAVTLFLTYGPSADAVPFSKEKP